MFATSLKLDHPAWPEPRHCAVQCDIDRDGRAVDCRVEEGGHDITRMFDSVELAEHVDYERGR